MCGLIAVAVSCPVLFGQMSPKSWSFGAASIRRNPVATLSADTLREDPGRVSYSRITLQQLVARAYGLRNYQVVWPIGLDRDVYEIVATIPEGATQKQIPEMLQALLAQRFGLVTHWESRETPVFDLVAAKGGLKAKPIELAQGVKPVGCRVTMAGDSYSVKSQTLRAFASCLTVGGRPVFDSTGLDGNFDISIEYSAASEASFVSAAEAAPFEGGQSIGTALRDIGLSLVAGKRSLQTLVVDKINSVPTEN